MTGVAGTSETRFTNSFDLERLPWFEVRDGRLVAVEDFGPVVDVHTHLALTYGRRRSVDLDAAPRPTEHYLPLHRPLDLDVYANRNFDEADLGAMKRDLGLGCMSAHGMRATHTAPNLLAEMRELGVAVSVLLPIELPVLSWNAETWIDCAARHPGLVSMGSVHPLQRRIYERLEAQKARGAIGVKIHPAVQLVRPDHPSCRPIYEACGALGLPVFWHCGPVDIETAAGRRRSQLQHYFGAVRDHPDTTFILGHSGALQMDQALELAARFDNVWMEIASQGVSAVKRLVAEAPQDRLMFGTDWPFYHQSAGLAKVLLATEGDPAARRRVFHENAVALFGDKVTPAPAGGRDAPGA